MLGRVKLVKPNGYGFIETDDGTPYFFNYQQYNGDWNALEKISPPHVAKNSGPIVQFQPQEHRRGPRALKVELVEGV